MTPNKRIGAVSGDQAEKLVQTVFINAGDTGEGGAAQELGLQILRGVDAGEGLLGVYAIYAANELRQKNSALTTE